MLRNGVAARGTVAIVWPRTRAPSRVFSGILAVHQAFGAPEAGRGDKEVRIVGEVLAQLLALVTFFAFPAIQYLLLKRYSRREGRPELWYLPAYGFRLVIRNIPGTKTLSDIRYRVIVRHVVPAGPGTSVATWEDRTVLEREDFFLFPGSDQVLLSFKLERAEAGLALVHTSKLGAEITRVPLSEKAVLIADFSATLENLLNFDVRLAKRVEVTAADLARAVDSVQMRDEEQKLRPTRVRDVG